MKFSDAPPPPGTLKVQAERDEILEALKPFADAVYNDNHEISARMSQPTLDDWFRAYRIYWRYARK